METAERAFPVEVVEKFVGSVGVELAAAASAAMAILGIGFGLYRALAAGGWLSAPELAARTGAPNVTCASGCATRRPGGGSTTTPRRAVCASGRPCARHRAGELACVPAGVSRLSARCFGRSTCCVTRFGPVRALAGGSDTLTCMKAPRAC
jgi:hypothetical protein